MINVTTTTVVTAQMICDAMITAIEGGSTYWCASIETESDNYQEAETYENPRLDWRVVTHEDGDFKFNRSNIERGLQLLADDHPTYFQDLIGTDEACLDGDGADVFFQLCALGEVVYA